VNGVAVSPGRIALGKGVTQRFVAAVTGSGAGSKSVTWTVAGASDPDTGIDGNGILFVAPGETAAELTIEARSVSDRKKYGTAVAPVIGNGRFPEESGITLSPPVITVSRGSRQTFGAGISPASGVSRDFTNPVFYTVTAEDNSTAEWRARIELRPLDTIAKIDAYLGSASGGGSAASPVPLPVQLNLSSGGEGWAALLSKIQEKGKYVALDLSACAMAGTEFDPGGANTGENRIVSLVLPAPAESIKAGEQISPTFKNFTVLKSLGGANVTAVGASAFYNRRLLATVDLPGATSIGNWAFHFCYYLATLNIPAMTSVGEGAFHDTGGRAAPSVSADGDNASGTFSRNVTIRTPAYPAGYGDTWKTNFKKAFGVSSGSYTVNINLSFQTITQ
jgi:hypothetical protein